MPSQLIGADREIKCSDRMKIQIRSPFTILFILLSLLVVVVCIGLRVDEVTRRSAVQGVLDLRGYDLDSQPAVEFGGEWAFFGRHLLEPKDFQTELAPAPDGFLTLPGSWKGQSFGGQTLGGNGFATLQLKVLSTPAQSLQAIRIAGVYSAYRLWANGRLVAESGRVGEKLNDEVMDHSLRLGALRVDGEAIDLVLQVSCFHMDKVGLPTLQLGRYADLNATQNRTWGLALFSAGTLLLMGIYHIALYVLYRSNRSPLYFGVYCLVWMAFVISNTTSDWAIRVFLPDLAGETLVRTSLFYYAVAAPLSYHVFRSLYPQEFPHWLLIVFWGLGGLYAMVAVAAPMTSASALLPLFHLFVAARAVYFLWALSVATRRKKDGAAIILTGFIVVCVFAFNDIFNAMDLIRTPRLMHVGMLFFMLAQSLALAQRFTGLFAKVEKLSVGLAEQNLSLEKEIAERARLQQEIVSISEDERRRLSHALHDGLCQQLTGARLQSVALEGEWPDEEARVHRQARLSNLLSESVENAYQLSRGLWSMGPESSDIGHALTTLAKSQSESGQVPIYVNLQSACAKCTSNNALQIFCVARESMANAVKHASPTRIDVVLDCREAGNVRLSVADDGVGRHSAKKSNGGLGVRIMAYRAHMVGGSFEIEDREEGGTLVKCSMPCDARRDFAGIE